MASNILNGCYGVKICWLLLALLAAAPAGAAPLREPTLEARLQHAFERRDPVELERAARRLGIGGLSVALRSSRAIRTAALEAAPLVPKSWLLLPVLLPLVADRDRAIAVAAADAIHQIAEDLRQPELQQNEDLPETLAAPARQLGELGGNARLSLEVRVKALLALAQLMELVPVAAERLFPLLADPEPAVRRSAVQLFVNSGSVLVRARLAKLVASDPAREVARAAAAGLCAEVALAPGRPAPALTALKEAGALGRLRQLGADPETATDELLELARCLTRLGSPEDRKLLGQLRGRSPSLSRQLRGLRD